MNKKFILFIVEGKNDKHEIEAMLHTKHFDQYRDKYVIQFHVADGDVTADKSVSAKNILKKMNDIVLSFRNNGIPYSRIDVGDIQEIIHVVDIDGTFISDENIVDGETSEFIYTDDTIATANICAAVGRNHKKAEILRKLVETKQIGNIPYSIYFVSCNMDHLLSNKRNLESREKSQFAWFFQRKCMEDPEYLSGSVFHARYSSEDYYKSWEEIQIESNSLQRKTNLNLFFGPGAKNAK